MVVRVDAANFYRDGRANIVGRGILEVILGETWIEEGTGGLYYTRIYDDVGGTDETPATAVPTHTSVYSDSIIRVDRNCWGNCRIL